MDDVGINVARHRGIGPLTTAMVGRAAELQQVMQLLAGGVRILTLTGRAGVGKTRLAQSVEDHLADAGVTARTVPLVGLDDPNLVMAEIASVLGVHPLLGLDVAEAVASWIGPDRCVLVLDNFEHLLAAAGAVHQLAASCHGLQVVVTSQAPLRLRTEQVLSVSPLPVPAVGSVDSEALAGEPAVALYCERARASDRHFALDARNAGDVAELCRRLDGLPLAIELAAARAAMLPAASILAALDADLAVLRRPRRDAPVRHHDLTAAISWSYELLGPDEQDLLRRLSVIGGSFDLTDAAAVVADPSFDAVLEPMSSLVDMHLIDPVRGARRARFTIPSTIRAFAAGELRRAGMTEPVTEQYVTWRAAQSRRAAEASAAGDDEATAELLEYGDQLARLLTTALDRGLDHHAVDLVAGLSVVWQRLGYHAPHREQVERLIERTEAGQLGNRRRVEVLLAAITLGSAADSGRDQKVHRERLDLALALARETSDQDLLLRALAVALVVSPYTGDMVTAARSAAEGLAIVEPLGDRAPRAAFEVWCGMIAHNTGDPVRALELGRAGLARARRTGDRRSVVSATLLLTPLVGAYPDLEAELPSSAELLTLARTAGSAPLELAVLLVASSDHLRRGDSEHAARLCVDALRLVRTGPGSPLAPFVVVTAATILVTFGEHGRSAVLYGYVLGDWDRLVATVPAGVAAAHVHALDEVRGALGDAAFERATRSSARQPLADGIDEAYSALAERTTTKEAPADLSVAATPRLTPRQQEVLVLLAGGQTNKEIGRNLGVAAKTVTHHLTAVYDTLGLRGRSEATAWAFRAGLIK